MSDCEIWKFFGIYGETLYRRECKRRLISALGRPIRKGYQANHYCDNARGGCVSVGPEHIYEGTQAQNCRDIARNDIAHRAIGKHNGSAKLTEEQVRNILRDIEDGDFYTWIARRYKIGYGAVRRIAHNKSWKNVDRTLTEL